MGYFKIKNFVTLKWFSLINSLSKYYLCHGKYWKISSEAHSTKTEKKMREATSLRVFVPATFCPSDILSM